MKTFYVILLIAEIIIATGLLYDYMCRKNTSGLIRAYYTEQIVKGWFALIAGALLGLVIWWIETTGVK